MELDFEFQQKDFVLRNSLFVKNKIPIYVFVFESLISTKFQMTKVQNEQF